jgi:hypothetical protein
MRKTARWSRWDGIANHQRKWPKNQVNGEPPQEQRAGGMRRCSIPAPPNKGATPHFTGRSKATIDLTCAARPAPPLEDGEPNVSPKRCVECTGW